MMEKLTLIELKNGLKRYVTEKQLNRLEKQQELKEIEFWKIKEINV